MTVYSVLVHRVSWNFLAIQLRLTSTSSESWPLHISLHSCLTLSSILSFSSPFFTLITQTHSSRTTNHMHAQTHKQKVHTKDPHVHQHIQATCAHTNTHFSPLPWPTCMHKHTLPHRYTVARKHSLSFSLTHSHTHTPPSQAYRHANTLNDAHTYSTHKYPLSSQAHMHAHTHTCPSPSF